MLFRMVINNGFVRDMLVKYVVYLRKIYIIMDAKKLTEEQKNEIRAKFLRMVEIKNAMCESHDVVGTAKEYGIELSCPVWH